MSVTKVPLNIFGMGFGLAGLATTWRIAVTLDLAAAWIAIALVIAAASVWAMSVVLYTRYVVSHPGALQHDLQDMTVGPFASLAIITPVLLVANGVAPYAHQAATIMIDVLIVLVVLLGGWYTGFWMRGGADLDRLHPGYFLPTVAGGFVASAGAAEVGQQRLAQVMFGLGLICWAIVGSMILGRLIFRPPLAAALTPTMAIEVAPAAVASIALFLASDGRVTSPIMILAGYGILMVSAQIPLLPRYLKLTFSLGTWAFTFSWAAVASATLFWVASQHPAGERVWSYLVLAAITTLIGAVAYRTLLSAAHHRLLPQVGPPVASAMPARAHG
jgi:tellurite resistance protein